jgi:hypothetical protein
MVYILKYLLSGGYGSLNNHMELLILFLVYSQLPPPFDQYRLVGVNVNPSTGLVGIRSEPPYRSLPAIRPIERNGLHVSYL